MSDIVIRIDRDLARHVIRHFLRLSFLAMALILPASELASESVTLSTYYPAPSGVYTQLITTSQTQLGTQGGPVTIGTAGSPAVTTINGALGVNGALSVNGTLGVSGMATLNQLAGNLQVTPVATEGNSCSVNGGLAQDGTGKILSCQSGLWQSIAAYPPTLSYEG